MSSNRRTFSCCGTQTEVAMDDIRTYSDRELKEKSCMVFTVLKEIITSDQFKNELTTMKFAGILHFLMAAFRGSSSVTELLQGLEEGDETFQETFKSELSETPAFPCTSHEADNFHYSSSTSSNIPMSEYKSIQNDSVTGDCWEEGGQLVVQDGFTVKEEVCSEESEDNGEINQQLLEEYLQSTNRDQSSEQFVFEVPSVCGSCGEELVSWDQVESHKDSCLGTTHSTPHQDCQNKLNKTSKYPVLREKLKLASPTGRMENISSAVNGENANDSGLVGLGRNEESFHVCQICARRFKHESSFLVHMKFHTEEKSFICHTCGQSFLQQASLNCHMRIHSGEKTFQCKLCGEKFAMKSVLRQHMSKHKEPKTYKCKTCRFSCARNVDLINHMKKHPVKYMCKFCEKGFDRPSVLCTHMRMHTGEKPYKCSICGVCFARQGHLNCHKRIHTGEKPHVCQMCGQCFAEKRKLLLHMATHTSNASYTCKICGCFCAKKSHLQSHMALHSGRSPFTCTVCKEGFDEVETLINHMAISHPVEAKYQCEVCGKTFVWKQQLTTHEKSHTGELLRDCKLCGRSFSGTTALERHLRVHTGEKPFLCSTCGKSFREKGALTVHIRIHTGEKPYTCPTCQESFSRKNEMKRHSIRDHGVYASE